MSKKQNNIPIRLALEGVDLDIWDILSIQGDATSTQYTVELKRKGELCKMPDCALKKIKHYHSHPNCTYTYENKSKW